VQLEVCRAQLARVTARVEEMEPAMVELEELREESRAKGSRVRELESALDNAVSQQAGETERLRVALAAATRGEKSAQVSASCLSNASLRRRQRSHELLLLGQKLECMWSCSC
jgi:hypothetical protein